MAQEKAEVVMLRAADLGTTHAGGSNRILTSCTWTTKQGNSS